MCVYIYIYIYTYVWHVLTYDMCDLRLSTRQAPYTTHTQVWVHSARTRHRNAACVFSLSYIHSLNTQPAPHTHRYESAARELEKNMPLSGVHRLSFWDIAENPRFFVVWFKRYIAARATYKLECFVVRCSALQYVAVCCIVLRWDAVWCRMLQCVQCVAVCCRLWRCVAVCWNVLQCDSTFFTMM